MLRESVLQSAGYDVLSIINPQEGVAKIESKADCGVLLLCYAVPDRWRYSQTDVVIH